METKLGHVGCMDNQNFHVLVDLQYFFFERHYLPISDSYDCLGQSPARYQKKCQNFYGPQSATPPHPLSNQADIKLEFITRQR